MAGNATEGTNGIDHIEPAVIFGGEVIDDAKSDASGDEGIPIIEPASINFEPEPGEQHKRRGRRPRGSANNRASARQGSKGANDLTGLLLSLHMMGAALTGIPEFNIEESEAKKLSEAINRVNDYYGGFAIPEQYVVWGNFAVTLGGVYGTRLMAYMLRVKEEAKNKDKTIDVQPTRVQ